MDCDWCGRYRPSEEIAAMREAGGRLVMVCARCRRLAEGFREIAGVPPLIEPAPSLAIVGPSAR
jgi:hypothetical protein